MWMIPPTVRIFLATKPADMRWAFDRLAAQARDFLERDPLSGHLFVFRNRRGDRVKILYWDCHRLLPLVQATRDWGLPLPGKRRIER